MGQFDPSLNVQLIAVAASLGMSALFLAHAIYHRVRREAEIRSRFADTTPVSEAPRRRPRRPLYRGRRGAALRVVAVAAPLAILGLAAIAQMTPALAQDQKTQQAALPADTAIAPGGVDASLALTFDTSFLRSENAVWRSDAAGLSPDRQARIQSCYQAARAAHRDRELESTFGDSRRLGDLNRSVSGFFNGKQRKSQFDGCVR